MKNKYLIMGLILVLTLGMFAACGKAEPEPEPEPKIEDTGDIPSDSILYFNDDEGSAELIKFFEDGNVPSEVTAMYDQMGSNPEITVTDPETIQQLYKYLSQIRVKKETYESITDCYHYIQFKLADDKYIHYSFEGTDIWCYNGKNYSIENSGAMFGLIKQLTEEAAENN